MADNSPNSARELEIELFEEDAGKELTNDDEEERTGDDKQRSESKDENNKAKEDNRSDDGRSDDSNDNIKLNICTSSSETRSIRSRVFVGHLNTDKATRKDLEKLFSKCGRIEAISMLNGYGFVQFDNEESARKAIEKHHGTSFFGIRLVVDKPAAWKKLDGENPREQKPWPRDGRRPNSDDRYHDRYSARSRRRDHDSYDDAIPSRYRDPDYERYLEMRYMEERIADRYRHDRLYDRYPPPPPPLPLPSRSSYPGDYLGYRGLDRYDYPPSRGYEYLRDDDYERERRPFDYGYGYR